MPTTGQTRTDMATIPLQSAGECAVLSITMSAMTAPADAVSRPATTLLK